MSLDPIYVRLHSSAHNHQKDVALIVTMARKIVTDAAYVGGFQREPKQEGTLISYIEVGASRSERTTLGLLINGIDVFGKAARQNEIFSLQIIYRSDWKKRCELYALHVKCPHADQECASLG